VDGDGDMDIFVGGRVIPGRFPVSPESYLLINDGQGRFTKQAAAFNYAGMVTDAQWHDINGDGRPDLFLVGEMMPISVYLNLPGGFEDATANYFENAPSGLWSAIRVRDMDGDGKVDILAANAGRNLPFRVSASEPAELLYADFDNNGSVDPFFCFYIQGRSYPYVSRDELNEQIYAMRRKFTSYAQYADATVTDILSPEELKKAVKLSINEQETLLLLQRNGRFTEKMPLPVQAQFSYIKHIVDLDANGDGIGDLLLLGNQTPNRLKMGAIQANSGCLLLGMGKGRFGYAQQPLSGLRVKGDVKSVVPIRVKDRKVLLIGASDKNLQAYEY
jgi:hypothetical protein